MLKNRRIEPFVITTFILGIVFIISIVGCFWELPDLEEEPKEKAKVHFVNVGQGDASVIEVFSNEEHSKKVYWIDAGGKVSYQQEKAPFAVADWLTKNPVDTVEWVLITHGDRDHFEGLHALLNQSFVRKVYIPHELEEQTSPYWTIVLDTLTSRNISMETIYRGHTLNVGTEGYFHILWPTRSFVQSAIQTHRSIERNDLSYVGFLTMRGSRVLFMGDAGREVERELLVLGEIEGDILKVGHHGSRSSSSLPFLAMVSPSWAIISGDSNVYGHPHIETVVALKKMVPDSSRILRTDREGTISFYLDKHGVQRLF